MTLDNTRSTKAVDFEIFVFGFSTQFSDTTTQVAPGSITVVSAPLTDHSGTSVEVHDAAVFPAPNGILVRAFFNVQCAANARGANAIIGDAVDCASLTVPLTLDNSQATASTQFLVTVFAGNLTTHTTFDVPAGGTNLIQLQLLDHGGSQVLVEDNELQPGDAGRNLGNTAFNVECGSAVTSAASATIGDGEPGGFCSALFVVPVTLDNTGSAEPTTFRLQALPGRGPDDPAFFAVVTLPAGATRIVQAQMDSLAPVLGVAVPGPFDDRSSDDALLATRDFTSSLSNCPQTEPGPAVLPAGATLPDTGGPGTGLPLIGLGLICAGAALLLISRSKLDGGSALSCSARGGVR